MSGIFLFQVKILPDFIMSVSFKPQIWPRRPYTTIRLVPLLYEVIALLYELAAVGATAVSHYSPR